MTQIIESGGGMIDKIGFAMVMAAMGLLFIALTQPVWNADKMIADIKSDCTARHGVMLEHKKMFGTSYECASELGHD